MVLTISNNNLKMRRRLLRKIGVLGWVMIIIQRCNFLIKIINNLLRLLYKKIQTSEEKLLKFSSFSTTKTFWGRRIFVPPINNEVNAIRFFGSLGFPEIKLIKFLIRNLKVNDVFYDVGASYGFYSVLADFLLEKGEIHAFEPHRQIFQLLKSNLNTSLNKSLANHSVLGNTLGKVGFYEAKMGGKRILTSTISADAIMIDVNNYQFININSLTLDEYCSNYASPSFIKLDAEGAETDIIKGGWETIKKHHPVISLEVWTKKIKKHKLSLNAVRLLYQLGYQSYWLDFHGFIKPIIMENLGSFTWYADNYIFIYNGKE